MCNPNPTGERPWPPGNPHGLRLSYARLRSARATLGITPPRGALPDLHLWQFEIGTRRYESKGQNQRLEPMFGPPVMDAATKKLGFFLKPVVPPVIYTYDFGDDWRHRVVPVEIRQMAPEEPLPRFLGGSWATPPEDIGGPPGYELFREARGNANHPEHDWAKEAGYLDCVHTEIHQDAIVSAFAELQKQKRRAPNPWMSES